MTTSAELRRLAAQAETMEDEATLAAVCELAGLGVRTAQSRERTADTAKRRAVVAWMLCDRLRWPQAKAARRLGRTVRQVQAMLRRQR